MSILYIFFNLCLLFLIALHYKNPDYLITSLTSLIQKKIHLGETPVTLAHQAFLS